LKWWEETNDEDTDADDDDDEDDFDEEEFAATSSVVVIVIPTPTKWTRWTQTQPETFLCWLRRQLLYAVLLSGIFSDRVIFGYSLRSKKHQKLTTQRDCRC